ncbi:hypothetical protein VQ045_17235 [Aurantimonas sp. E1-2-R+4]|uniref:hypothetical protein n=1 Tax=Aurantimonas sp. E1-2-R+4 TaxID=3113714 RepID=UPI002F94A8B9
MIYNLPTLHWLTKKDPDAALAIFHLLRGEGCAYVEPGNVAPHLNPVDRNPDDGETHEVPDGALTSETMSAPVEDGPDEVAVEMLHEVKPDIHDMLRSAGGIAWPWSGVRVKRDGKVRWKGEPWAYQYHAAEKYGNHTVTLGGLRFYTRPDARRGHDGGMLLSYTDAKGRTVRPSVTATKPRGGKRPHRTKAAVEAYLSLPPAIPSPMAAATLLRPTSGSPALMPMLSPTAACAAAKATLAQAYANTTILPTVTHCPTAIAKGARFIAGISGTKQTASAPAPLWQEREISPLSPILDEVAARGTLESIGIRLGYSRDYADRAGKRALLAEGRSIVAANGNVERKSAA